MLKIVAAVCNYNRRDMLVDCVRSFLEQPWEGLEIFVLDNASTDGSAEALEALGDPRVHLRRNGENEGSSGGFYHSIHMAMEANPDYVAVLDSDCIMGKDTLPTLARFLDQNPSHVQVGPKIYWARPAGIVQELGAFIDWPRAVFERNFGDRDEAALGALTQTAEVDYVPACCLLVRADAIRRHGNMRSDWFIYFDDIEWATRMKRAGWRIAATPDATAVHHGGGANKSSHFTTYYYWRNRIHFFREYGPEGLREATEEVLRGDAVRAVATCATLGAPHAAAAIGLAVRDAQAGRRGKGDFSGIDLSFDKPNVFVTPEMADWPTLRVEHVLEDAEKAAAGGARGLILEDGFRKRLPLEKALALLPEYRRLKSELRAEFSVLFRNP